MIRLSGARCLAMSVVGAVLGWWISLDDVSTMAHYRALTHDALMQELAQRNDGSVSSGITGGLFLVVTVVLLVDVLNRFFDAIWRRIEPAPPGQGTDPADSRLPPPGRAE
jgi:hypothetical protein